MAYYQVLSRSADAFELPENHEIVGTDLSAKPNGRHRILVRVDEQETCIETTSDGEPCQREAEVGSQYCWQHS